MDDKSIERRSLARDLLLTDLADQISVTELVVSHALAPCRRMYSLPTPRADEGERWKWQDRLRFDGSVVSAVVPMRLDPSPAHFQPVISGLALYSGLFPFATPSFADRRDIVENPSSAWLDGSWHMAAWMGYDDVARQVNGLYLPPREGAPNLVLREPWPNPEALIQLRSMQALLLRLVGPPSEWGDIHLIEDTGLERVDMPAAIELDVILRRDVHRRLIWLGNAEPILPEDSPDGEGHVLTWDGGVFPALVPETISGAIALDYADGLARHRRVAVCGHCNRAVVMSNQQVARDRKGLPVFHDACAREHRLGYFRDYQRGRAHGD